MGFLDDESISGTTKVDLGRGYWVEVRNCLSREKVEVAEGLLTGATIIKRAEGTHSSNTAAYRTYMVAASIVSWNLDDGEGESARIWEYNNDAAIMRGVKRLPDRYFFKIWTTVNELNGDRSEEEQARFPDGGDVGDPAREAGAAAAEQAAAGALALEGTRSEPFGLPQTSVA